MGARLILSVVVALGVVVLLIVLNMSPASRHPPSVAVVFDNTDGADEVVAQPQLGKTVRIEWVSEAGDIPIIEQKARPRDPETSFLIQSYGPVKGVRRERVRKRLTRVQDQYERQCLRGLMAVH